MKLALSLFISAGAALLATTPSAADDLNQLVEFNKNDVCQMAYSGLDHLRNRYAVYLDRFLQPTLELEKALASAKSAKEVAQTLTQTDYRGSSLFKLESLLHVYEDSDWGGADYKKLGKKVEALEDQLGAKVDADNNIIKMAPLHLPEAAALYLQGQVEKQTHTLAKLLEHDEWIGSPSPVLKDLVKALEGSKDKIPAQKDDAEYLMMQIDQEAKWLQVAPLDMNSVEDVHRVKRHLRWITILISALRGRVEIVDVAAPASWTDLQFVPESAKKYLVVNLSPFELKDPIQISKPVFYIMSHFIQVFDKLKSDGILYNDAMNALLASGSFPNQAAADSWLVPQLTKTGWQPFGPQAHIELDNLRKSGAMKAVFVTRTR